MRRTVLLVAAALALIVVVVVGLIQAGGGDSQPSSRAASPAEARRALAGAPPELAALHAQSNRLLPGGKRAFRARLTALEGYPVVVNKWASWCGPCRFEFPFLQSQSLKLGRRVAFLGVNSNDNRGDAARFLRSFPVSYPSYEDPDEEIARSIGAPANYPITVFYNRGGEVEFVHQGPFRSEADLIDDIRRYALG